MLNRWQIAAIVTVGIVALLYALSLFFPADLQLCTPNEYTHAKECAPHHLGPFIILWVIAIADSHNGLVTALATVFVAGFTWTLWRTGRRQGDLAQKSIDLARDEFNATHRPRLFVHTAEVADKGSRRSRWEEGEDNTVQARTVVRIANGGEAPLRVVECQCI